MLWTRRSPGEVVVRRDIHRGRIWSAAPLVVLDDGDDELVTVRYPGSEFKIAEGYPGFDRAVRGFATGEWTLETLRWKKTVAVGRVRPDRPWNVIQFHDGASFDFICWYANFERPVVRHPDGAVYDTLDLALDLVVFPNGATVWKDEDHWEWVKTSGLFDHEDDVAAVEAAREHVMDLVAAKAAPFDGSWVDWRPDEIVLPSLPSDWDRAPAREPPG